MLQLVGSYTVVGKDWMETSAGLGLVCVCVKREYMAAEPRGCSRLLAVWGCQQPGVAKWGCQQRSQDDAAGCAQTATLVGSTQHLQRWPNMPCPSPCPALPAPSPCPPPALLLLPCPAPALGLTRSVDVVQQHIHLPAAWFCCHGLQQLGTAAPLGGLEGERLGHHTQDLDGAGGGWGGVWGRGGGGGRMKGAWFAGAGSGL
jgi:hypothetical protein